MHMHPMAQRIELCPIDKLIPFARNPRTHSEAQVTQIAASIAEFGFNNPILVDTKAGIIAGHGRVRFARLAPKALLPEDPKQITFGRTGMLTQPMAQRIELWPLEKLVPFARNPRTH